MSDAPPYEPDTKDWTWVLDRPCPDCGFDAAAVAVADLGEEVRANAAAWPEVLGRPGATTRPEPTTWSPTEYACHVRDVHGVFAGRVAQVLAEDGARFDNWDQDEAAVVDRYDLQSPEAVLPSLAAAAERVAAAYDAVPATAWERTGLRSNGSHFTLAGLGRYHLHDVVHHLWDVG
ncbi:maleylpyruvate isomerase N-terminal domain-containing protein [Nocardioides panacisoli]|uniref:DinB family protein n=1 Tax=Nocardioides panacisoli TaxID=627624 RepID=UPI001C626FD3|nr:DinB family protein [Nocardioides panacisoli]QYJ05282.1 maleylpyruvate isomerase N-terminal domain-containing protein [Nocardioides panacisoli]